MENSSATISNQLVELETAYKQALENHFQVEQAILELARDIINLQGKRKELEIQASKSNHILRQLKIDISLKTKEFWSTRQQGL